MSALQNKNADRDFNIGRLQARIQELQRTSLDVAGNQAELGRLRSELTTTQRDRQADIARLEQQRIGREKDLGELRARETELEQLRKEVDRYRQQVADLENKVRSMANRSAVPTGTPARVIVPSF